MNNSLIQKYNVPGPRYTSYPTVPYWEENSFSKSLWIETVQKQIQLSNKTEGISLYIHLPFCESLCTFCGCHKRRHDVEEPYIKAVLKEWDLYLQIFGEKPMVKEIHLGGGTPTFFSEKNLEKLINGVLEQSILAQNYEFSFEGHPNNTTKEHLLTLYKLGFRRVSFGVQDYSAKIQEAIHRIQPYHQVAKVTLWAKEIGYTSVNHDLIFGLPFQNLEHVIDTIEKTNALNPDRLAFYSYAHVPWIKGNGQRGFADEDVPKDEEKRKLYEKGKKILSLNGFEEIGMDHFAKTSDSIHLAFQKGKLNRNFMGYTTSNTRLLVGLGMSAISDSWFAFAQNEKDLDSYYQSIKNNELGVFKGHCLNNEDLILRQHILNIMCKMETSWANDMCFKDLPDVLIALEEIEKDGLIILYPDKLSVTNKGKVFIRNICMAFDLRLTRNKPDRQLFSLTI